MTRAEEVAWAAGLFEGEGCFTIQVRERVSAGGASVRAQLTMTDEEPLRRFARIVAVGDVRPKPAGQPWHKDAFMWRVTNRAGVEHVLELFEPWLGPRRLVRGREVLRLQDEAIAGRQRKCSSWSGPRAAARSRCSFEHGHEGLHSFESGSMAG